MPNYTKKTKRQYIHFINKFPYLLPLAITILLMLIFRVIAFDKNNKTKNYIGLVEVTGIILDSQTWLEELRSLEENEQVKAILVRVNSPGGVLAPTQEIYQALRRIREQKPIFISMGTVAASGGFYLSMGGSKIYANPGTVTGSIGVIMQSLHYNELFDKIGITSEVISSGVFKDAGNPYKKLTEATRTMLQAVIDDGYENFLSVILENRDITEAALQTVADGRIISGNNAHHLGLVDTLGGYEETLRDLREEIADPDATIFTVEEEHSLLDTFLSLIDTDNPFLRLLSFAKNLSPDDKGYRLMSIMPSALY